MRSITIFGMKVWECNAFCQIQADRVHFPWVIIQLYVTHTTVNRLKFKPIQIKQHTVVCLLWCSIIIKIYC